MSVKLRDASEAIRGMGEAKISRDFCVATAGMLRSPLIDLIPFRIL